MHILIVYDFLPSNEGNLWYVSMADLCQKGEGAITIVQGIGISAVRKVWVGGDEGGGGGNTQAGFQ